MIIASSTVAAHSIAAYLATAELADATSAVSMPAAIRADGAPERSYLGSVGWGFLTPPRALTSLSAEAPLVIGPPWPEDALFAQLASFRNLPSAWDGESAAPPNAGAIDEAIRFVRVVGELAAVLEPTLHVDGSVLLEIGDGSEGSLKFKGDGTIIYATEKAGLGTAAFDGSTVPEEIRPALAA